MRPSDTSACLATLPLEDDQPMARVCWILTASSADFALTLSSACKEPVLQVETVMKRSGFGRS